MDHTASPNEITNPTATATALRYRCWTARPKITSRWSTIQAQSITR